MAQTSMFGPNWSTSERRYGVIHQRDIRVRMPDGVELAADVFRPADDGRFPAIIGYHPYDPLAQWAPIMPGAFASVAATNTGLEKGNGPLEAGDPNFFVRRGYVHVIANVRGTGNSGGSYPFLGPPEPQDGAALIEWAASQPWCNGSVGMFGVSYFGRIQLFVAAQQPPHLKCLFAPWASTDQYRDALYQGGILAKNWALSWGRTLAIHSYEGETSQEAALQQALGDPDLRAIPELIAALRAPDGAFLADVVGNPLDNAFWDKRKVDYAGIKVPAYIGGDWGIYGLHLPGAFRSWEQLSVPKKMLIGPPAYLERPVYQLQYEALRWFDYWLKGMDNGIMDEAPVRLFLPSTRRWRSSTQWPLPETKWTPFYLHEQGLLWEHEHFPNEACSSFSDSPWGRGMLEFSTPKLVEETELIGPVVLNIFASTSSDEVLWFVSLREVAADGSERVLTRGWLRGTHRAVDDARSLPWRPYHPHDRVEPLEPGRVYEFNIGLVPTGQLLQPGSRLKLRISGCDDAPTHSLEAIAGGHIRRQAGSRVTVFHNEDYPSHLLLPITGGNIMGTYISGAAPYLA